MSETLIQLPRDEGTKGQRDKGNAPLIPLSLSPSVPSSHSHHFIGYAKLIGAITFLSRLLGMARESIAANYFGSSAIYSAFALAFTIPNLFRKLLGEGALSAAFIPLYAKERSDEATKARSDEGKGEDTLLSPSSLRRFVASSLLLQSAQLPRSLKPTHSHVNLTSTLSTPKAARRR